MRSDASTTISIHPVDGRRIVAGNCVTGAVRARLAVSDSGDVGLYLFDIDQWERLLLSHAKGGTALFLKDEAGDVRVGAAQFALGGGGFTCKASRPGGHCPLSQGKRKPIVFLRRFE